MKDDFQKKIFEYYKTIIPHSIYNELKHQFKKKNINKKI